LSKIPKGLVKRFTKMVLSKVANVNNQKLDLGSVMPL